MRSPRWIGVSQAARTATIEVSPATVTLDRPERLNAAALESLTGKHNVKLTAFPGDMVDAARKHGTDVLGELAKRDAITAKVHKSYMAFRENTAPWSRVSIEAVLGARG